MKQILYHWTLYDFNFFNEKYLWWNIQDLLSFLWFHFTKDISVAKNLFAFDTTWQWRKWKIIKIIIEENETNSIEYLEKDLILEILEFWLIKNLVTKQYYNKLSKLPYWDSFWWNSIVKSLYNNWKREQSPNFINKKELASLFKQYLLSNWIEIIKYKNEIEWSEDNRFDYIILDPKMINIIEKENI